MPSFRPRTDRCPTAAPSRVALPRIVALCRAMLLAGLGGACTVVAASDGDSANDATTPRSDVEPVGDWPRFAEVGWRARPIRLHLPP